MKTFARIHSKPVRKCRKASLPLGYLRRRPIQTTIRRILDSSGTQGEAFPAGQDSGRQALGPLQASPSWRPSRYLAANHQAPSTDTAVIAISKIAPTHKVQRLGLPNETVSPGQSEGELEVATGPTPPGTAEEEEPGVIEQGPFGLEEDTAVPEANVKDFCIPYPKQRNIRAARRFLRLVLLPAELALFGSEVAGLYQDFLRRRPGDSLNPKQFIGPQSGLANAFTKVHETHFKQWQALTMLDSCPLLADSDWHTFSLAELESSNHVGRSSEGVSGFQLVAENMNFDQPLTKPGNVAGGVSSSDAGPDRRQVSGGIRFRVVREKAGEPVQVEIQPQFRFLVTDAIDFCPGGAGAGFEKKFTVPLSRLEKSKEAYDVPFQVSFDGPKQTFTMEVKAVEADRLRLHRINPILNRSGKR
jgi:hypothetical protein